MSSVPVRDLTGAVAALALGAVLLLGAPSPAEGQSLLSTGGLGVPSESLDARARGMGSVGAGLFGSGLLPADPGAARELLIPTVTATLQQSWGEYDVAGARGDLEGSRFPLIGVAYPVPRFGGMAVATFGSFMDMRWSVEEGTTVDLAGRTLNATDRFRSDGGISVARLGWAGGLGESVAVAVGVGSYIGDVDRRFVRDFEPLDEETEIENFISRARWRFTGPTVQVGVVWDPSDLLRLSGVVNWSGDLHAEPAAGAGEAEVRDFEMPTEYRAGASAALTPRISATAGLTYADWTATGEGLREGEAVGEAWSFGGGLEWDGPRIAQRDFPVRLGYRTSDLPFRFGDDDPTESAFSVGLGLNLAQTPVLPLARIDLALERGDRAAGVLSETFWRLTGSIRLAGN